MDAKRYLMQKQNGTGSFLVWKMKNEDYCYLSGRSGFPGGQMEFKPIEQGV